MVSEKKKIYLHQYYLANIDAIKEQKKNMYHNNPVYRARKTELMAIYRKKKREEKKMEKSG